MADTHWLPLLVILSLLVDGKVITEEDAARMDIRSWQRLIASDPVTCARYWRHYMDSLLTASCSCDSVMGHVEDFFLRDEFQQRGSPHLHWLALKKDAPKYSKASDAEVCAFTSRHISCQRDPDIEAELIQLQVHNHSDSCYRKDTSKLPHCRF
jgi:hypothetical protein